MLYDILNTFEISFCSVYKANVKGLEEFKLTSFLDYKNENQPRVTTIVEYLSDNFVTITIRFDKHYYSVSFLKDDYDEGMQKFIKRVAEMNNLSEQCIKDDFAKYRNINKAVAEVILCFYKEDKFEEMSKFVSELKQID
jgi:hypothetical protein